MQRDKPLLRRYACADCGADTVRWRWKRQPLICPDCSIERSAQLARQMKARSGPLYDHWYQTRWPGGSRGRQRKE